MICCITNFYFLWILYYEFCSQTNKHQEAFEPLFLRTRIFTFLRTRIFTNTKKLSNLFFYVYASLPKSDIGTTKYEIRRYKMLEDYP